MIRALPRGTAVLLRGYDAPDREVLAYWLRRTCHRQGRLFLVAGDADLARRARADGVHLPEHAGRRPLLTRSGRPMLITMAAHGMQAMARAGHLGVDGVVLSPVFPTRSHPGSPVLGPHRFARLAQRARCPVYALGGITAFTVKRLPANACDGLAAIDGFWDEGQKLRRVPR